MNVPIKEAAGGRRPLLSSCAGVGVPAGGPEARWTFRDGYRQDLTSPLEPSDDYARRAVGRTHVAGGPARRGAPTKNPALIVKACTATGPRGATHTPKRP